MSKTKTEGKGTKKKAKEKSAKEKDAAPKDAAAPVVAAEEVRDLTGSEADYVKYLPLANAVDLRDVVTRRIDTGLACHNAVKGAAGILKHKDAIAEQLPKVSVAEIEEIPRIASALAFAALQLDHLVNPDSGARALLTRARPVRRLLLGSAIALAEAGVLDRKAVKKIQLGAGALDAADDCVVLATLFSKNAAKVKGLCPVTPAHIKEAAEVGAKLKSLLKPKRASRKVAPTAETEKAMEMRDRFWALLVQRYELAWRVGAFLLGKDGVAERVPSLQSYAAVRRAAPAPEAKAEPAAPA